jgi:release factor glutamine methyltransferase
MTIKEALETAEIERLDAEILLCHVLECSREFLITENNRELTENQHEVLKELYKRRSDNEPVAYITGTKEFYGHQFVVTPHVLIPRPATEGLVDLALDFVKSGTREVRDIDTDVIAIAVPIGDAKEAQAILDVGTGSGCIAIIMKKQLPELEVFGTDISEEAVAIAERNAELSVVKINNSQGSLLDAAKNIDVPFIIVSNPPYIPEEEALMKDVADYEPSLALRSGEDGGDLIRELIKQAVSNPLCRGLVVECKKEHQKLFENINSST